MSNKDKDLKKVLSEIKNTMNDEEFACLKNDLLMKVNQNSTLVDIMQDPSLRQTFQGLMQNENISSLLKKAEFKNKITSILSTQDKEGLIQQIRDLLINEDLEKKKMSKPDELQNLNLTTNEEKNSFSVPEEELHWVKEETLLENDPHTYAKEIAFIEAVIPFFKLDQQKTLQSLCEFFRHKGVLENMQKNKASETIIKEGL